MTLRVNPHLTLPQSLVAAEAPVAYGVALGEDLLYDDPLLYSWLSADIAVDGSGNYADKGPRGFGGLQATGANQPAVFTNGTTGRSAWTFDGSGGTYIPLNFDFPVGAVTVAAVVDLDSGTGAGDGLTRPILGSMLDNVSTRYYFGQVNRQFKVFNQGGGSTPSGTQSVSTPLLCVFALDPANQQIGQRVNGGSWVLTAANSFSAPRYGNSDVTGMIGAYRSDRASAWKGHVYDLVILTGSLADSSNAATLALVESTLKGRHGIA